MRTALLIALVGLACAASGCTASAPTASASGTPQVGGGGSAGPSLSATSAVAGPSGSNFGSEEPTMPPEPSATNTTDFVVRSSAFNEGGAIPRQHTCDGQDLSPEIAWSGAPEGTLSLALVVRDPDARGFVHWIVYDIPAATDGTLPTGVSGGATAPPEGMNGFGRKGYGGPCPPSGTHHYVFTLYALDRASGLPGTPGLAAVEAAMRNHVVAQATLTGTYKRS